MIYIVTRIQRPAQSELFFVEESSERTAYQRIYGTIYHDVTVIPR